MGKCQKKAKELPEVAIRRLMHGISRSEKPCKVKHPVGGVSGLYLQCNPPVGGEKVWSRQWILRARVGSARHEFGLGSYPTIPTQKARGAARALKVDIANGIDPKAAKAAAKAKMVKGLFAKKKLKVVHTPWHSPFGSHFPDPRLKSSQSFYNEDSEEE